MWMTFISYESSKKILINQAIENLKAINLRQAQAIENYFEDKESTAVALVKGQTVENAVLALSEALYKYGANSAEYAQIEKNFRSILTIQSEMLGYRNLLFVNSQGDIIFSSTPSNFLGTNLLSDRYRNSQLREIFQSSKDLLQTQTTGFIYYDLSEPPAFFIAAPILKEDRFNGAAIMQIDNSAIYKLITDYTGLGDTGESILVTEIDRQLIAQSPLRGNMSHEYVSFISANTPFGHFVQQVLNGKRLTERIVDYHNKETLSVGRYFLPTLNLGIITKIDLDELLSPAKKTRFFSWLMALVTAFAVFLVALHVAYTITRPILEMTRKTRLMTAGDLSQRIDINGDDEIARLGKSFNDMAYQLDNMIQHLDVIVANRTGEVEQQNTKLENTIEELQQTQNRLVNQEKLASLGSLTAGIAHEIKNPLNFINNFAELSLQVDQDMEERLEKIKSQITADDADTLHEYLETLKLNINKIYEHGKRADSIVRNMLHHSRGTPGEMVLSDINALLDEYVALSYHGMRAQDSTFNVKFEKNYDASLPPTYLVPQEMSRVFLNILNNAYYSIHQKKKRLKDAYNPVVRVSTNYHHHLIVITIWDNGEGIPEEVFLKLFTPFFSTKPAGEGTGLGLSLSYNIIVQGHQGTLTADSKAGEFAEFVITLPVISKI
jgi:signal transduction histidine kinase